MNDLWERPVEVANWLDLVPSVQHDHTAQNNPLSLPLSPDVNDAPSRPLTRGPHVVHHDVEGERSPRRKQFVNRQSHATTIIFFLL